MAQLIDCETGVVLRQALPNETSGFYYKTIDGDWKPVHPSQYPSTLKAMGMTVRKCDVI